MELTAAHDVHARPPIGEQLQEMAIPAALDRVADDGMKLGERPGEAIVVILEGAPRVDVDGCAGTGGERVEVDVFAEELTLSVGEQVHARRAAYHAAARPCHRSGRQGPFERLATLIEPTSFLLEPTSRSVDAIDRLVGAIRRSFGAKRSSVGSIRNLVGSIGKLVGAIRKLVVPKDWLVGSIRKPLASIRKLVGSI
jgi:hypothetical protein